jgi:hypothetical protein
MPIIKNRINVGAKRRYAGTLLLSLFADKEVSI